MAFQREGVLLFARDAEFFGQDLGGRSHNKAADGIGQPHFQSDARLEIRRPQTDQGLQFLGQCFGPSQMGQDILQFFAEIKRDIAHRLRSPGDVAIPLPQLDFHRGLYGRFDAGSAIAVHRAGRHGFGDAAQEGDHPGDVGGVRRLADVAEDHFVNLPRFDAGTFQKLPRGDAPELLLSHLLDEKGISVETDFYVERVDADRNMLVSYDERELPYDLLVTVPVNMGAAVIARSGLGDELNHVPVDKGTFLSPQHANIFAIGDAAEVVSRVRRFARAEQPVSDLAAVDLNQLCREQGPKKQGSASANPKAINAVPDA